MSSSADLFKGAENASVTVRGTRLNAGPELGEGYNYLLKIKSVVALTSRKEGKFVVFKFEVLTSNDPKIAAATVVDYPVYFKKETAMSNIRGAVHAALGFEEIADSNIVGKDGVLNQRSGEHSEIASLLGKVVEDNILEGANVIVNSTLRETKDGKNRYAFFSWAPVKDYASRPDLISQIEAVYRSKVA